MTSIDYQVGASADDGMWYTGTAPYSNTGSYLAIGQTNSVDEVSYVFMRFPGVTIPDGSTIIAANLSFYFYSYSDVPPECTLYAVDEADSSAISSASDGASRSLTSASIPITGPTSGTWWDSNSIVDIIAELLASNSYESGGAMQFVIRGPASNGTTKRTRVYAYNGDTSKAPKLHIEYTEAASGDPEGSLIGGKLIRGGLLLHGVLGR